MFFFFLPVGMNYRTERFPIVTISLIVLNTLIWLVSELCTGGTNLEAQLWIYKYLWLTPADFHWYSAITSMFVHGGFFHLCGNMIFLFLFGCCVEDLIGRTRFLVFYLLGGLMSEMVFIAMSPDHFMTKIPMGGASGAISACLGMFLLLRAGADIEFKWVFMFFLRFWGGEFSLPAWVFIPFWFLKNLFFAALGMQAKHTGGGVAFGAHVGGFVAGLAAIGIYKLVVRKNPEYETAEELAAAPEPVQAAIPLRPAAQSSETPTIFLHNGAQQTGPFTLAQIQEMLHRREISPDMHYWSEGLEKWQRVAELSDQPSG